MDGSLRITNDEQYQIHPVKGLHYESQRITLQY